MELGSSEFWTVVVAAATVATFVATGLSVLLSIWWRYLDRQEADWVRTSSRSEWRGPGRRGAPTVEPVAMGDFANAGDGMAFRVTVSGSLCDVEMVGDAQQPSGAFAGMLFPVGLVPALGPGGRLSLRIRCDPRVWDEAEVHLRWRRSPTWRRFHSRRYLSTPLSEIAQRPTYVAASRVNEESGELEEKAMTEPPLPALTDEQRRALTKRRALRAWRRWRRRRRDRAR